MLAFSGRGRRRRQVGSMKAASLTLKAEANQRHGEHPEFRIAQEEGDQGRGGRI